jgi:hypothetical protein
LIPGGARPHKPLGGAPSITSPREQACAESPATDADVKQDNKDWRIGGKCDHIHSSRSP